MENQIQLFTKDDWQFRSRGTGNDAMFCLVDVAKCLEYSDPSDAVRRLCKKGTSIIPTETKNQHGATVMTKMKWGDLGCVFALIMKSKAKKAESFQNWVCREVLPSIMTKGYYGVMSDTQKSLNEVFTKFMGGVTDSLNKIVSMTTACDARLNDLEDKYENLIYRLSHTEAAVNDRDYKKQEEPVSKPTIDLLVTTCPSFLSRIMRLLGDMNQNVYSRFAKNRSDMEIIVVDYSEDAREALERVFGKKQCVTIKPVKHATIREDTQHKA